jgi:hypothetical protein
MFFLKKDLLSTDIQLDTCDTGYYEVMLQFTGMPLSVCTKRARSPSHYTPSVTPVSTARVGTIIPRLFRILYRSGTRLY